jgi:hypothetical protein
MIIKLAVVKVKFGDLGNKYILKMPIDNVIKYLYDNKVFNYSVLKKSKNTDNNN